MQLRPCEMIGCKQPVSGSIQLGPGTRIDVCKEHLIELEKELGRGQDGRRYY